jgi:hypothetical protein
MRYMLLSQVLGLNEIGYKLSSEPDFFLIYIYILFSFTSLKIICTNFNQPLNITFFSNLQYFGNKLFF